MLLSGSAQRRFCYALKQLRIKASHAWMVGNSWRSDVVPALEAGLRVVWIDAHVWEYERSHQPAVDDRVSIVKNFLELPSVVGAAATKGDVAAT